MQQSSSILFRSDWIYPRLTVVHFPSPNKFMRYSCLEATSWVISFVNCSQIMKFLHVHTVPEIRNILPLRPSLPTLLWLKACSRSWLLRFMPSILGREQWRSTHNRASLALEHIKLCCLVTGTHQIKEPNCCAWNSCQNGENPFLATISHSILVKITDEMQYPVLHYRSGA